ncbi:MAG: GNAT family N-acetyltransferase [Planctomycetota bacterium]
MSATEANGGGRVVLRAARDEDSVGIIRLIAACYAEYPPNVLDVDLEEPELRHPARDFEAFWVLEDEAKRIVGCIALATLVVGESVELKKCYVSSELRGGGWGRKLVQQVEDWARGQGVGRIELWTDTRFTLAHKVYAKLGYAPTGRTRDLHDLSQTTEFHFDKELG